MNSGWRSARRSSSRKQRHDLKVAIHAGDHQDLLEDLRRLRQREELARDARGSAPGSRARPRASTASGSASRSRGSCCAVEVPRARRAPPCAAAPGCCCSAGRRRSRYRYRSRVSSATGESSLIGNGGVFASFRISSSSATTSISPVGNLRIHRLGRPRESTVPCDRHDELRPHAIRRFRRRHCRCGRRPA